jgi:hypothetical protein
VSNEWARQPRAVARSAARGLGRRTGTRRPTSGAPAAAAGAAGLSAWLLTARTDSFGRVGNCETISVVNA